MDKISEKDRSAVSRLFLFGGFTPEELEGVLSDRGCSVSEYRDADVIYSPDSFTRSLGYIIEGSATVYKRVGEKQIPMTRLTEGCVFGAATLFGNNDEYVTLILSKGKSRIVFLTQRLIAGIFVAHPSSALYYIGFLSDRIRFLNERITSFTGGSALQRLARWLLSESPQNEAVNMKRLADSLDISRASLYRAISVLVERGAISYDNNGVSVKNEDLLFGICGDRSDADCKNGSSDNQ